MTESNRMASGAEVSTEGKRVWVVGASTGIGLALTARLLSAGYRVVASARRATGSSALSDLEAQYPKHLRCVDMDVTHTESPDEMARAVDQAWSKFEGLDLWFYNVGVYELASFKDSRFEDYARMNASNYLGCVALMHALRPKVLAGEGPARWVWNLSIANQIGLPYGGGYSAPKAALLNLAEALQPELRDVGVRLQVVNHGFVKTRLTAKNPFTMPALMTPETAAERLFKLIDRPLTRPGPFETHFPKRLTLFLKLMRHLPYAWQLALTRKMLPHD
ncbi:MAG: SDR family NAD(P)-dependent oxidoreductase [Hydrogenovibrio sp.]|uniref:SDR family NAD(P)-dependent oxidoreductase n=1 Tax=Hydrogenovibrio sp. TaxID=2065821 RepID=UPI002870654C|nr:SDR family NAD(P)-dependent oxidoreductase [Hydrogenovibrio sp.]MDR9498801.1 SDR family NAD(P)-dependent oxidoreductase [Hydrogenovibrio sp.]